MRGSNLLCLSRSFKKLPADVVSTRFKKRDGEVPFFLAATRSELRSGVFDRLVRSPKVFKNRAACTAGKEGSDGDGKDVGRRMGEPP